MRGEDEIRLRHMLEAAREALGSVAGRGRDSLDEDRIWALGIMKCVEIIGEAASHVGEETRREHPELPWTQIVGMRNRLVHVYFDIDMDQVWSTLTEDLPALAAELARVLDEAG